MSICSVTSKSVRVALRLAIAYPYKHKRRKIATTVSQVALFFYDVKEQTTLH